MKAISKTKELIQVELMASVSCFLHTNYLVEFAMKHKTSNDVSMMNGDRYFIFGTSHYRQFINFD